MNADEKSAKLKEFVAWKDKFIIGDEKGEAQIFLDKLFQAFGWLGFKEAGAICEMRIKKSEGGTAFADLVWKPVVLIEMKKITTDLTKHYRQAFDYWTRLVPHRPRYVILCNFDELWVYDFETQMDIPVDKVLVNDISERFGPLAFMYTGNEQPVFGNHHETVSRKAADKLALCFGSILGRCKDRDLAQRFILQTLMALFAQNIGLLEKYFFSRLLDSCTNSAQTYDAIGGLFEAMNTPGGVKGGQFKGVQYFNGGLFAKPARIELKRNELNLLKEAASFDWSKVSPEIFGTLFEHCLEDSDRSAFGIHFTSLPDIMHIGTPTVVEPWRQSIEGAKTLANLRKLLVGLQSFRVLDPACGSGNFLYISYREIKRLEARIYERMGEFSSINQAQRAFGFVTVKNFYGIDINPTAIAIAKVTMTLAHKLAIEELHINENALPLDNLDQNFACADALIDGQGKKPVWPHADVIIGNPPFLGARKLKPLRGKAYADLLRAAYPEVPGSADYCVYWLWRSQQELPLCTLDNLRSGRAGLVGTQNIRNSQHRVGGLDHIVADGTILEAVDNQPWSGEAAVNVSIVNWANTQDPELLPVKRRLWHKNVDDKKIQKNYKLGLKNRFELTSKTYSFINSALSGGTDTRSASTLITNVNPQRAFQGITPGHAAFVLSKLELKQMVKERNSNKVIFPYLIGNELIGPLGAPSRFLIDFQPRSLPEAASFGKIYDRIEERVLQARSAKIHGPDGEENFEAGSHHQGFLKRWWRLSWERSEMVSEIGKLKLRYLACSRVTKRPIFTFISKDIRPGDRLQTFMFDDDYSFGILQSKIHAEWFIARCPKQTERFIYTTSDVFNTFPWPQKPSLTQIKEVAASGLELRKLRTKLLQDMKGGLRSLYRTLDLPGENPLDKAHRRLDEAVAAAYGMSLKKDVLAQVLDLNRSVARAEAQGQSVLAPGLPANLSTKESINLRSADCVSSPV